MAKRQKQTKKAGRGRTRKSSRPELSENAEFAADFIDIEEASGVEGASWEDYQIVLLNDESRFSHWKKSRQVAWSFTVATEAVIEATLNGMSSLFVSINQDEASEKIRYARSVLDAFVDFPRPELVADSVLSLEFENGARIESLPAKAPRGRARRHVYLDEMAHIPKDSDVFRGAMPVVSKGGRLRMGSSTAGARGTFWDIDTQSTKPYPGFKRFNIPWWSVEAFTRERERAIIMAPDMSTEERVYRFGRQPIIEIFENSVLEDFQQEFECKYVDEVASWITWDEIKSNQRGDLECIMREYTQASVGDVLEAVEEVGRLIDEQKIEWSLAGGVDIGRTRNTTEIFLCGDSTTNQIPLRLGITLDGCKFSDQEDVIHLIMKHLPVHTLLIDKNGLGMQLAENMEDVYPGKAQGFQFTAPTKKVLATGTKLLFQKNLCPIPVHRALAYQVHSIRRTTSKAGIFIFDTDASAKHHADMFWSLALAHHAVGGSHSMAGDVSGIILSPA